MDELELRQRLAAAAARAMPDGSHPATDILTAAASRRRRRFRWSVRRLPLALGVAIVGVALATAGAVAMGGGTFPVQFNLINLSPAASAKLAAAGASTSPTDDAATRAAEAQKLQAAAQQQDGAAGNGAGGSQAPVTDAQKQAAAAQNGAGQSQTPITATQKQQLAASGAAPDLGGSGAKPSPADTITLAQAEASFGGHVLTPSPADTQLRYVAYAASDTQPLLGRDPAPTVSLNYDLGASSTNRGTRVEITEQHDASNAPLTVDALNQGGPKVKTTGSLGPAAIETINGGSYIVGRLPDGQSVEWLFFKTSDGLIVTVHFLGGVSHDDAVAFVTGMN